METDSSAGALRERTEIIEHIESWLKTGNLLIRCGEMSRQELRTVKAVLKAIIRGLEAR